MTTAARPAGSSGARPVVYRARRRSISASSRRRAAAMKAWLAPDIVQALLDGRGAADLTLPRLLEPFPTSWAEQREMFGCQPSSHTGARG